MQEQVGLSLKDLLAIPQVKVTLAVMQSGTNPISIAIFLNYGENGESVRSCLKRGPRLPKRPAGRSPKKMRTAPRSSS